MRKIARKLGFRWKKILSIIDKVQRLTVLQPRSVRVSIWGSKEGYAPGALLIFMALLATGGRHREINEIYYFQ